MLICPKCGKKNSVELSTCDCGELLRAEVTNIHSWETETVFRPPQPAASNHAAIISIALVVVTTILALAWPQLRSEWNENGDPQISSKDEVVDITSDPARPQVFQSDSVADTTSDKDAAVGIFDFSDGRTNVQVKRDSATKMSPAFNSTGEMVRAKGANGYDAPLLEDKAGSVQTKETASPDCKPDITVALKLPEKTPQTEEEKTPSKPSDNKGYILGPRGGCFIVTASGGKKYVDRALCSTAAAARQ